MRSRPFSNGAERDAFQFNWCEGCPLAYEGDEMCDEAAIPVLLDEGWPEIFAEVPASSSNPLGVVCTRKPTS